MSGAMKKWELWVLLAINSITGLTTANVVPATGRAHALAVAATVVLTNVVALFGRQVVRGEQSRKTDKATPPPVPPEEKKAS